MNCWALLLLAFPQAVPDTWSTPGQLASTPAGVALDGDLAYPGTGDFLYMTTIFGEHTRRYFRYSLVANTWEEMAIHPDAQAFHLGTSLISAGGDRLFNFIGEFDTFWAYSISANAWTFLGNTPAAMFGGAEMAYPGAGDFIFARSGGTDFWRYQISTNTWINTIADAPTAQNNGGSLVSSGGDFLYSFQGDGFTTFQRYSISGDAWATMTAAPFGIRNGGDLVYPGSGDFIFALRGDTTTDFYRYSISGNAWTIMAPLPAAAFSGSTLCHPGTGSLIYAIRGDVGQLYRYRFKANEAPNPAASTTGQFKAGGATAIAVGASAGTNQPVFKSILNEPERDMWRFEIEVLPVTSSFTSTPTQFGGLQASGTEATLVSPTLAEGPYHWRFRFVDNSGATSAWTSFGGNADGATDFVVGMATAPSPRGHTDKVEKCLVLGTQSGSTAPSLLALTVLALLLVRRR